MKKRSTALRMTLHSPSPVAQRVSQRGVSKDYTSEIVADVPVEQEPISESKSVSVATCRDMDSPEAAQQTEVHKVQQGVGHYGYFEEDEDELDVNDNDYELESEPTVDPAVSFGNPLYGLYGAPFGSSVPEDVPYFAQKPQPFVYTSGQGVSEQMFNFEIPPGLQRGTARPSPEVQGYAVPTHVVSSAPVRGAANSSCSGFQSSLRPSVFQGVKTIKGNVSSGVGLSVPLVYTTAPAVLPRHSPFCASPRQRILPTYPGQQKLGFLVGVGLVRLVGHQVAHQVGQEVLVDLGVLQVAGELDFHRFLVGEGLVGVVLLDRVDLVVQVVGEEAQGGLVVGVDQVVQEEDIKLLEVVLPRTPSFLVLKRDLG